MSLRHVHSQIDAYTRPAAGPSPRGSIPLAHGLLRNFFGLFIKVQNMQVSN